MAVLITIDDCEVHKLKLTKASEGDRGMIKFTEVISYKRGPRLSPTKLVNKLYSRVKPGGSKSVNEIKISFICCSSRKIKFGRKQINRILNKTHCVSDLSL